MNPAEDAQLALLLEVAGTPKPGNVDRERDFPDLRFEHFLGGAVGAGPGLRVAQEGVPVGEAFERAVEGMSQQAGGNTQFGALLLLVPLVRAAAEGDLTPEGATRVVEDTTVEDAANFFRAFDHADVFVDDPPEDAEALDVRRGSDAVPAVEERGVTLYEVLALGDQSDDVAAEWTGGFERTFWAADRLAELAGSAPASAIGARVYLELLAREPDTLVAKQHGAKTAESVHVRAQEALEGGSEVIEAFADSLVEDGVNPGTTADLTAAGLFVALARGEVTV
ncbi:triphosphoribosyl-dephospho-CoA synthase [Halorussus gelatinilyticus]|uniref:Triphosphoribosyl-dephospho-CoA synthase n=1 Tax=Halorussus gelatinilyticus TaxID=2937524 RepID=A0A8U0IIU6_9EURY|nr:triphosphoribosyl-dephospho-CoA synthase [Halorussus gelatinilyticus]UPW00581.1 triphosphoribosyl-dephospho-CoA synthase [Halorussus gelatinilyticus]